MEKRSNSTENMEKGNKCDHVNDDDDTDDNNGKIIKKRMVIMTS